MIMKKISIKIKEDDGKGFKIKMPGGGLPGEVNSLWGVSTMNSWCKINRRNKKKQEVFLVES